MVSLDERLRILREDADERKLEPKAWWLGESWHTRVLDALGDDDRTVVTGGRLIELDGLPVKVLSESPERFALWCDQGVLDL